MRHAGAQVLRLPGQNRELEGKPEHIQEADSSAVRRGVVVVQPCGRRVREVQLGVFRTAWGLDTSGCADECFAHLCSLALGMLYALSARRVTVEPSTTPQRAAEVSDTCGW